MGALRFLLPLLLACAALPAQAQPVAQLRDWTDQQARAAGFTLSEAKLREIAQKAKTRAQARALLDYATSERGFELSSLAGRVLELDASDASTLTITSGNVTAWRDKAQGLSFTVPSGANAPAAGSHTVDGVTYTVPEFDAANTEALEVAAAVVTEGPFTAWVVFASTSDSTVQTPFAVSDVDASNNYYEATIWGNVANDPVVWNVNAAGTTSQAIVTPGYTTTETFILRVTELGTSRSLALDGGSASSATATRSLSGLDATSVGRRASSSPTNYYDGRVMATVVVRGTLTTETRELVEDLLWRKWIHDPGFGIPATGLVLHTDPSDESTLTITSSPDVDSIANLANKTIASLDQGTASRKPHTGGTINGRNALAWPDRVDARALIGGATVTAPPFSLVQVFQPDSGSGLDCMLAIPDAVFGESYVIFANHVGNRTTTASVRVSGTDSAATANSFTNDTPNVAFAVFDSATAFRAYLNGGAVANGTTSQTPTVTNTWIGYIGSSFPYAGEMGPSFVYKRALAEHEVRQIHRALSSWGVQ